MGCSFPFMRLSLKAALKSTLDLKSSITVSPLLSPSLSLPSNLLSREAPPPLLAGHVKEYVRGPGCPCPDSHLHQVANGIAASLCVCVCVCMYWAYILVLMFV
jgi:hypothetical protein